MGYVHYRRREYASALKEFALVQKSQPNSADLIAAIGYVERRQGQWKDAVGHLQRVLELDPGSATAISQLAETMTFTGEYDQAIMLFRRGMEVGPDQPDSYYFLTLALLAQSGDVAEAARAYRQGLSRMPAARLVSGPAAPPPFVVASDDSLSRAFLALPAAEIGNNPDGGHLFRGELLRLRGDGAQARIQYDSARVIFEKDLRALPNDYGYHRSLGLAYARLGKMDAAIREGKRAVELLPPERDAYFGVDNVTNLARIYAAAGQPAPAVEQIRRVQALPSRLTAASLRVDPDWDPIRHDPAFQQLLAGGRP
jgi:tetratricopeptide (TPR) repeat protein